MISDVFGRLTACDTATATRALVLAALCIASVAAQDGATFDVASIKRSAPAERQPRGFMPTPGRFTAVDLLRRR
jgi:hypothetical protein